MFNLNGYKYWTMGAHVSETILINRTAVNYKSEYDDIAKKYVTMFQDKESVEEEVELFYLLDIKGKVLDIGCGGSGVLLKYVIPEDYVGIDPSRGMLEQMAIKFPDYSSRTICCKAEDFYREGFDTIVALFGTASYIEPHTIERLKDMLNTGGKMYLMFYLPTYTPVTHIETGINPHIYKDGKGGQIFHNYNIVTYTK
jgi:cyclopropane fatty-acyl-phospholipid synthase-like methyltransferase